ncbi:MAG TPA: hypothetical protein VMH23_07465 [Bacteroidota bacterium]|nr:hypothetical protein [Bacteroidota bacterium]
MDVRNQQELREALDRVASLTVEITKNLAANTLDNAIEILNERGKTLESIRVFLRQGRSEQNTPGNAEKDRISGAMVKEKNDELLSLIEKKRSVVIRKLIDVHEAKAYRAYLLQGQHHGHL